MASSFESSKFRLDEATKDVPLDTIASQVIDTIAHDNKLTREMKKELLSAVRAWANYVEAHDVKTDDLFAIRWHIEQFAHEFFHAPDNEPLELLSTPVDSLILPNRQSYVQFVKNAAGRDVIHDPDTAFFGGVARIALKLHGGLLAEMDQRKIHGLISPELPVSDIDIIINRAAVSSKGQLNADLAGTRIVGDIASDMQEVLSNIDCTFNQALVWQGMLYFTAQGLEDARAGVVRLTDREDALFGSDTTILDDGKQYIRQKGFYRGFSFLLRRKASVFPVYKENLDREARNIGRYWVILLSQKLLPIADKTFKERAIRDWFNLAKRLGVTTKNAPHTFLEELLDKFPETRSILFKEYESPDEKFDNQARWLARKLIKRALGKATARAENPPLSGMSDQQIHIDSSFYRGPHHNAKKLLQYIEKEKIESA